MIDAPYKVTEGITEKQIEQLINFSAVDPLITQNTNDPNRFSDKNAYSEWLKKGKFIYCLTDGGGNLQGITWFGIKPLPLKTGGESQYKYTFAIRLYKDARGKGLSQPFMDEVFNKFLKSPEYTNSPEKGIWLETRKSNAFAINLYNGFGFKKAGSYDEMDVMTYTP